MKKAELLLPAGSLESMHTAFLYGADAVYAGLPSLSLRASEGFSVETLSLAIKEAHEKGKKIYLTLNLFSKNEDVENLKSFAEMINTLKPDGLIVSDAGVFMFMKEHCPNTPLHISTQANVGSWLSVDFWKNLGAKVCVLSRETSFKEIAEIKKKCPDIKIEMFVHGAMCLSYSGRCLLSSFMVQRSANRGKCAHACRWKYKVYLEEELRPGEFLALEEDNRGSYIMNSKDLCLMPYLDEILNAGIDMLKVEGRNKTPYYVAQTTRAYRKAIDDWYEDKENWRYESYQKELDTLQNRGYTKGFFYGVADNTAQNYQTVQSQSDWRNAGVISKWTDEGAYFTIYQKIIPETKLCFLSPFQYEPIELVLTTLYDGFSKKEKEALSPGRIGQSLFIPHEMLNGLNEALLPVYTVARMKVV